MNKSVTWSITPTPTGYAVSKTKNGETTSLGEIEGSMENTLTTLAEHICVGDWVKTPEGSFYSFLDKRAGGSKNPINN